MPILEENKQIWGHDYDWGREGHEWSDAFGDDAVQWYGALLPRIHSFVPTGTILEIAPGFGRWSAFLRPLCDRLILLDISGKCVDACRERFKGDDGVVALQNDGYTFPETPDASVDFVFSFDSLVHADEEVMRSYAREIARVLKPSGIAWVHHSNMLAYGRHVWAVRRLKKVAPWLTKLAIFEDLDPTVREIGMSAEKFRGHVRDAGLTLVGQELLNWGTKRLSDCITVACHADRQPTGGGVIVPNPSFSGDAARMRKLSQLYHG